MWVRDGGLRAHRQGRRAGAKLQQAMKTLEASASSCGPRRTVKEIEDKVLALREKYDESTAYKDSSRSRRT